MIPEEIKENVFEGFEPLLVSEDVVDNNFLNIVNTILDFDNVKNTDAQFIELMKDVLSLFVGEWIEEL